MSHTPRFTARMKSLSMAMAIATLLGLSFTQPAEARDHSGFHGNQRFHDRGHEARYRDNWENGRWMHGRYKGRDGWWWVVGDRWSYYSRPVYPYPYEPRVVYAPPVVVAPPQPSPGINFVFPIHIR